VWRDTNPGLAHGYPDIDGLRKFVRESEHRPAQREVFKRSHLGMWLDSAAEPAFDLTVWDEGRETFDIVKLEGCKAWIGVDLSKVTDLCAVSASIQMPTPANEPSNRYALHVRSFATEEGIRKRSDVDHVPYVLWRDQGYLTATPGDTVDLSVVESAIREMCELFDVQEIAFDRWSARQMMDSLAEDGLVHLRSPEVVAGLTKSFRVRSLTSSRSPHAKNAACVAPDLVRAAVKGRLPRGIGVERLRDAPAEWSSSKPSD